MTEHDGAPRTPQELERRLIASARLDVRPAPAAVRHRILLTVTTAGAIGAGSAIAGATPGVVARLVVAKWVAATMLVGAAGVGTYAATHHARGDASGITRLSELPPPAARHASEGPSPASPPALESPSVNALPSAAMAPSIAEERKPVVAVSSSPRHRSTAAKSAGEALAVPEPPSLESEVAALDRVRASLAAGDSARALDLLDAYQQTFPLAKGALRPEATYLRIQSLLKSGQRAAARDLALRFSAEHPDSPHVPQLKPLLSP